MKLYNSMGPNPQIVRTYMAERGITLPKEEVDLMAGANRQPPYLDINPAGQLPALVLDDGSVVTEVTAICEYLEETQPGPSMLGATPEARAQVRRWTRWADLNVCEPLGNGFRFSEGLPVFKDRMRCLPEAADGLKACAQDKLSWLDGQLSDRDYLAGSEFSLADIVLSAWMAFGEQVGQPVNRSLPHVSAWFDRCMARQSARA
ncbi:MAG: glutathione S-transferase family protein [Henriciella sp.]|jgi:glutathione S-transferase